ncbi:MAG: PAS domain S-box protein, partial [Thermoleophilia bacterium]|nr:PAS domain S-box protein [Thermoleophilia bacterium]
MAEGDGGGRLAQELERQRQYFESLLDVSPVAIVTTDLEGVVTSWNPAAESLFGYAGDEAVGRTLDDLIATRDDLHDEAQAFKEEALRRGRFHAITQRTRKDGALVDVEVLAVAIEVDGEHTGYYAIYHDVRDLHRQKRYYESLLEVSPTAIATTDLDANVTSWNPAAERLFGYTAGEAIGRNIDDLVAKDERLHAEAADVSRRGRAGEPSHVVTRRTRKDGTLVDVEVLAAPIFVGDEQVAFYALYHDISELQRQKQYYASLFELSPTAIVTIDRDGNVTSWNAAAERLFGYAADEAIGRNIDDLVAYDEDLRADAAHLTRLRLTGATAQYVRQRNRKDGSLVDVEIRAAPIVVGGEEVGHYVIYHDISELQRQRRYYEALLEVSPTAVVTFDLDTIVTSWNPAAERLFGYTADEAIGRNIDDLVATEPRLREEAVAVNERVRTGEIQLVTQRTRKDGSLVDVQVLGAPVSVGGELVGYYALYHDISELQRQRRYYEALVESSPIAIALLDAQGCVTAWNPRAEQLFGYMSDEAVGRHIDDLVAYTDELRDEAARYTEIGMGHGAFAHAVTRRTRKDGTLVDVELFGAPVLVAGEPAGLYAMYHDVGELQRARREAEAATEAKSAFLATMSHEIRTPMNAVIGMTDLLLQTELDPEQRSFAEVIRTSGEALLSVINDILDFSKIEAGRLDLDREAFDLRESVESALELVARAAAEKDLDLAYLLRPGTPEAIVGDASRLRQVLLNLLNNAVKFTEEGEVVVTVHAEPFDGAAADGSGPHRLHFAVRDTGIGIAADRLEGLFESFSQVDASTTRRYGGTGLGLAISKRLSELMGGAMWVESRPGEGSTFHFTILADPAPPRARAERDAAPLAGRRVLIVDDNATNRDIVRLQTEGWGMVAQDTGSPQEALAWMRAGEPFDVGVLDMQMPGIDGVALAREIRALGPAEELPLVLLTSLGRREDEADEALFAARLTKPIRPSQLYDALLDIVGAPPSPVAADAGPAAPEPAAASAPLRVLIAEDNAVNRQLALLLLEKLGHRAAVAVNGREAVEAVERDRYDVVLMDVQMPEMDGLEATRAVRERF